MTALPWKQDELVLEVLKRGYPTSYDARDVADKLLALNYPENKRKVETLRAVLHRLSRRDEIVRAERGRYAFNTANQPCAISAQTGD